MLVAIIAKTRNQRAGGLAYLVGIFLLANGVPTHVISLMSKLKISASYTSIRNWFGEMYKARKIEILAEVVRKRKEKESKIK